MQNRKLDFYTDGAYSSKSQMGGWATLCVEDDNIIDVQKGYEPYTTNNRMELSGFLAALEAINTIETGHAEVTIYTDSAYISNCINNKWYSTWMKNGWKTSDKQDVKNQDLWSRIIALYIKNHARLYQLAVVKVKGHSDNKYNKAADMYAVRERQKLEVED